MINTCANYKHEINYIFNNELFYLRLRTLLCFGFMAIYYNFPFILICFKKNYNIILN